MDEQRKYEVIKALVENGGNKLRASVDLGVTLRHINRLIRRYCELGAQAFIHGNRGKPSKKAISPDLAERVVKLYSGKYYEANFKHFTKLLERKEDIKLSVSSITRILEKAGVFSPMITKKKKKRVKRELEASKAASKTKKEEKTIEARLVSLENAHPRRPRCAYFGELLQMDACIHNWFGNRKAALHIAIDDASSLITGAYFDNQETLNGYYNVLYQTLTKYGIPSKFLTDRRTVFVSGKREVDDAGSNACTQFAYACKQLGTFVSYTSVPQAKGRVERAFQTLQSRLPIELRTAGVTDIEAANIFLERYIEEYNAEFAQQVDPTRSVFITQPSSEKINLTLAVVKRRVVDAGHCLQIDNRYYRMLDAKGKQVCFLKGTKALVIRTFDGRLLCSVKDELIYALDEVPAREKKSKEFDADYKRPEPRKPYIPPMQHSWRIREFYEFINNQKRLLVNSERS